MRIGIDATALPPQPVGAGNYIIQLIRALSALEPEDEYVIFAQKSGRTLIDLPTSRRFHWQVVEDMTPAVRLMWEQTVLPRLTRQAKIDVLHSLHYTKPLWPGCASVVTFHDMTFFLYPHLHTRSKRIFFPIATRMSARQAKAIIADSESTRQDIIRLLRVSEEKVFTVLLGVDPSFRPIKDSALKKRIEEHYHLPDKFILYLGMVEPRKNLPMLIRAYNELVERGAEEHLVVAGRFGWMYEDIFRLVELFGLKDRVHFTGYVSQNDLPVVYNLARVFVYPTLYEGFGLPPLEAMACGVPVITTNVSSLPEIVGDAGILIPANDRVALVNALENVLNNREISAELAAKGPQRAAQFTWERTARQTLKVYQHVLDLH